MANDEKKDLTDDILATKEKVEDVKSDQNLSKNEKKAEKQKAKKAKKKAEYKAKKQKLADEIEELKVAIENETDDKKKQKLRKQREEVIQRRETYIASKGKKSPLPRKTVRIIKSVIAVVVIVAILVTYFATGLCRHGLFSSFSVPQNTVNAAVITNKDGDKIKVKVSTYNFYFATMYNNLQSQQSQYKQYGMDLSQMNLDVDFDKKLSKQTIKEDGETITWDKHLENQVLDSIKSTYTYYNEAVKANKGKEPEITKDQKKELKETIDKYTETANGYGYTLSGYLVRAMGKGVSSTTFKREATIQYISQNYQEEYNDKLSKKEYKQADYDKYVKDNKSDLVSVDARVFECSSADDAKAFAKALKSDGSNFTDLASKYASTDFYKQAYKDAGYSTEIAATKSDMENKGYAIATADSKDKNKYPGLDWVYSSDRKAGDVKQYSTTVIYITKPVNLSDIKTVSVRHILISPITDKDSKTQAVDATAKQWATAKKKAETILATYNKGKKTESEFAKLAEKNSTDTGSSSKGGLYEDVTPGQMVSSFNAWCFDGNRKVGDVGIVKSDYGYHIIRFDSRSKTTVYNYKAQQSLSSKDSKTSVSDLEKSYTIKTKWLGSRYFEKDVDIDS